MNPLTDINAIIAQDFEDHYTDDEFIEEFETADDARDYFDADFEERYNSDNLYVDLDDIKQHLNYIKTMLIAMYVSEKRDEYGMQFDTSLFNDDMMLKSYIYFYVYEEYAVDYINRIERHFDGANPQEGGAEEETKEATT